MPGSIKIDDGSGNYTILTNAGSLGSDKTITIPNETATLATTTATDLGGLVKLTSGTASSSSALTFDNFVDDTLYSQYNIVLRNMIPGTDNTSLMFRFRKGGSSGSDVTGSYFRSGVYYYGDVASSGFETNISNSNSAVVTDLGSTANETMSGEMVLYTGGGNSNGVVGKFYRKNPYTNLQGQEYAVGMGQSDVVTGLQFFMASGNIASGEITIYGMKK